MNTIQGNTLHMCGLEERPVEEQILLLHMDELLCRLQHDEITEAEKHHIYHVAVALMSLFNTCGVSCPKHYNEWISEITLDIAKSIYE